jgi:hypothetical protein
MSDFIIVPMSFVILFGTVCVVSQIALRSKK